MARIKHTRARSVRRACNHEDRRERIFGRRTHPNSRRVMRMDWSRCTCRWTISYSVWCYRQSVRMPCPSLIPIPSCHPKPAWDPIVSHRTGPALCVRCWLSSHSLSSRTMFPSLMVSMRVCAYCFSTSMNGRRNCHRDGRHRIQHIQRSRCRKALTAKMWTCSRPSRRHGWRCSP